MRILVTGHAGFIGYHTVSKLLARGDSVVGIDSINDYYDPSLKEERLRRLSLQAASSSGSYVSVRGNIADKAAVDRLFAEHKIDRVINLAAQAGVRYSLVNPYAYIESNITGFTNIIEACRHNNVEHLTYASTSSVYGANTKLPFSEHVGVDHPLQFYAATKRANELIAHSYSHLFALPTTGLRFFTVYGPWGRPDMALFLFTRNILAGKPIDVFNDGNHSRDFTYVEDIAEAVVRASDRAAQPSSVWNSAAPDPATSNAPYRIYNIGNSQPSSLSTYIEAVENALGRKAIRNLLPLQPGDVPDTYAVVDDIERDLGFRPRTTVAEGVAHFVAWYRQYYNQDAGVPASAVGQLASADAD